MLGTKGHAVASEWYVKWQNLAVLTMLDVGFAHLDAISEGRGIR